MSPEKALEKAKIGLMFHRCAFINTVIFSMNHVFSNDITTACTDGKTVKYSPNFFMSLTEQQRLTLLAHEAWHPALLHITRGKGKDPNAYNRAGDYVINLLLIEAGFVALPNWLYDKTYRGMSTEQVYAILIKDPINQSPAPMQDIIYTQDAIERTKLEQHIETVLLQASTQAQLDTEPAGEMTKAALRTLDSILNPIIPWMNVLTQYLIDYTNSDYSWKRLNKRYMPDYYLPSMYSTSILDITIAIDTSGSMSKKELYSILGEIEHIRDTLKPKKITLIDCDYEIHNVWEVTPDTELSGLPFTGGGGSNCYPVFDYCESHTTNLLIYFTDLHFRKQFKESVDFPVLWIVYNNPNAKTEIGEIIKYTEDIQ